ncbi:MAG: hypothetical protein WD118_01255 [Phycisphaeraceae bacterium]
MNHLSPAQIDHFLEYGYIKLEGVFPRDFAKRWVAHAWDRLGYDPADASTWAQARVHMPAVEQLDVRDFAPDAWSAACDLLGGEDRIRQPYCWSDAFIANMGSGAGEAWQPPSADVEGWHVDGDAFMHFLDTPEQALLTIVLWSDVEPRGGPTYIATDSIAVVARYLADHPEGVEPNGFPFDALIRQCHRFEEATGQTGDVFLMHPFMMHTASANVRRLPRFIINPRVRLIEPMNFDRADPADFSPVERGVLRGLGVDRYAFQLTGERREIVPPRVRKQAEMRAAEIARLAAKH